ncbi:MAG: hypothetical protein HQL30_02590 [Candidatus Omnitrophica bacterium]|nr:hypothetical protein [Candidatus Omnitrophota bacterium]
MKRLNLISILALSLLAGYLSGFVTAYGEDNDQGMLTGAYTSTSKAAMAELRAYVDKSTITIGENVKYTLEIDLEKGMEAEFPSYSSGMGGFAVKDFGKDDKKLGMSRVRKSQWYLMDTYTTGSYVIPGQIVRIKSADGIFSELKSSEIFIEVKSVMDKPGEKEGLRDIKGPLTVKSGTPVLLAVTILVLVLIGGAASWSLYRKKFARKEEKAPLSPNETALLELTRIEDMDLCGKGRTKEHYYLVSLCLRTYLEGRFALRAPEQTTEEFLGNVRNSDKLDKMFIGPLKEFMELSDLVKYAGYDPGRFHGNEIIRTARDFVVATTETVPPVDRKKVPDPAIGEDSLFKERI